MELRHLRYFVTVAEELNVSRAAARLRVSQPAISRQLRDLEAELGVELFIRDKGSLKLSAAGEQFLAHARDLLRRANEAVAGLAPFRRKSKRKIAIGYIAPVLANTVGPGLRHLTEEHAELEIELQEMNPTTQIEALRAGRLDVALIGSACHELETEFAVHPLKTLKMQAVLPDNHLLALRKRLALAELAGEGFIGFDKTAFPGRNEIVCEACQQAGFTPSFVQLVDNLTALLTLVSAGKGIALVPEDAVDPHHPGIKFIPLRPPEPKIVSSAVTRKNDHNPFLVQLLKQAMTSWTIILGLWFLSAGNAMAEQVVHMLVPGFKVEELPVHLSNQNNLRFAPDGSLTALGYDGKICTLKDTDGDGLEDRAEPFWDQPTLSVPLGMAWTTGGLLVSSKGKVSLLTDTNGDGHADIEKVLASGWPSTDVGSGGVDATAVTLDNAGNIYFGLLVADYSNAYRLRKRKDLKAEEIEWLKAHHRWQEPDSGNADAEKLFSLYDLDSKRGTIQKLDARTGQLSTVATGIRVPVALAFNGAGDLFNTDQEGETWMPNGNPLDELNWIIPGHNYGFPPADGKWLSNVQSDAPVLGFGPQHQSSCGMVFNIPRRADEHGPGEVLRPRCPAQGLFGPAWWRDDAFIAGESRGKIWRVHLIKTPKGYVAAAQTIARLSMLTLDTAISPSGALYVCCHSGNPDWGTGPHGAGRIFKLSYVDLEAALPRSIRCVSPTELRVRFDRSVDNALARGAMSTNSGIEFGEYVSGGDRYEVLKPPYAVVAQEDATPRGQLHIHEARVDGDVLILQTDPHPLNVRYALTLSGVKRPGQSGEGAVIDVDYDLTRSGELADKPVAEITPELWKQTLPWAPRAAASGGTDSRASQKPRGDWDHGKSLFYGESMQCGKCHRIRGEGSLTGPDLSNLEHRDSKSILRDILHPSATIHPDYVTYRVVTKKGETYDGFLRAQQKNSVKLFDASGKDTVIDRAVIERLEPTTLSLMPEGLLEGKSETDIRDLLTFLLWSPPRRSEQLLASLKKMEKRPPDSGDTNALLKVVLVADKRDHGPGQHDYPHWQTNWAEALAKEGIAAVETAWQWPAPTQFETSSVLAFYCWNHAWTDSQLKQLDTFLQKGGGLVFIHAAVIADKNPEALAERIGLSAQPPHTGYRHMPFDLRFSKAAPSLTRGLPEQFPLLDEPYWPMIGNTNEVRVLASAEVDGEERPLVWLREVGKGRVFVSVPGHYTTTWDDPAFRTLLWRGLGWAGHREW